MPTACLPPRLGKQRVRRTPGQSIEYRTGLIAWMAWTSQDLGEGDSERREETLTWMPGVLQRCAIRLSQGEKDPGKGTNCTVPEVTLGKTRDVEEREVPFFSPPPSFQCFWQNLTGSQLPEQCSSWNPSPRFTNRAAQIWSSHSALVKLRLPVFINHSCSFEFPHLSNLHFS